MSCDIRVYKSLDLGDENSEMSLTAFVGSVNEKRAIQFTIGGKYCALSESACLDLISTIARRINCEDGFQATGDERIDLLFRAPI